MKRYAVLFKLLCNNENSSVCGSDAIVPLDARNTIDNSIIEVEDAIKRKERCIGSISGYQIMRGDIKNYSLIFEKFKNYYPIQKF